MFTSVMMFMLRDQGRLPQGIDTPVEAAGVVDFFSGSSFGPLAIEMRDLEFGKRFSSGAFGDISKGVYRGEAVAIKSIRSATVNNNEFAKKEFQQEVLMLSMINHAKIVRFIGAAVSDSTLLIVTELMDGGNLRQ